MLRSLESGESYRQVSFNRSTTYARSTSYDVILVLHASNAFALPPSAQVFKLTVALSLLSPLGTELVASPRSPTGFHASFNIPLLERVRLTRRQPVGHLRVAQMCMVVTQRTHRVTRGLRSLVLTADNLSVGRIRNAVCIMAPPPLQCHRIGWRRGVIACARPRLSSALPPRVNANSSTSPACRPARGKLQRPEIGTANVAGLDKDNADGSL